MTNHASSFPGFPRIPTPPSPVKLLGAGAARVSCRWCAGATKRRGGDARQRIFASHSFSPKVHVLRCANRALRNINRVRWCLSTSALTSSPGISNADRVLSITIERQGNMPALLAQKSVQLSPGYLHLGLKLRFRTGPTDSKVQLNIFMKAEPNEELMLRHMTLREVCSLKKVSSIECDLHRN